MGKKDKHFVVMEPAFTSGEMLHRQYKHIEHAFPLEDERVCLHHYPNYKNVTDADHYQDWRARSQHIDPHRRRMMPKDQVLRDAVSDEMVTARIQSEKADNRKPVDAKLLALRFAEVHLDSAAMRELKAENRVDWSCTDIPAREDPDRPARYRAPTKPEVTNASQRSWALSGCLTPPPPPPKKPEDGMPPEHRKAAEAEAQKKWHWCLGGREIPKFGPTAEERALVSSQSLPLVIPGKTLLPGAKAKGPAPFHGVMQRPGIYGTKVVDHRMRGSTHAREGFAGTFPEWEAKK